MNVHGICDYVLTNGRVVVDDGELKVSQGSGRYIKNPAYAPYVYDKVETNAVNRMMREVGVPRTEEDYKIDECEVSTFRTGRPIHEIGQV